MTIRVIALFVALLGVSCASPPPAPIGPNSVGLAIHVKVRPVVRLVSEAPAQVLFVRLSAEGGSITDGEPIPSNYASGDTLYLLNAAPGTYVAVACFKHLEPTPSSAPLPQGVSITVRPGPSNYTTYFQEPMIHATTVTPQPGRIAFMGNFVVDQNMGFEDADPTQRAYYAQFGAGDENENLLENALGGDFHYRGTLHESDTGASVQADFAASMDRSLLEAGWQPQSAR